MRQDKTQELAKMERKAKRWFRAKVGWLPKEFSPNWTFERVAKFALDQIKKAKRGKR